MNIENKKLAISILSKFVCGMESSQTFSPKKYSKANLALKETLNASKKWNCKVLTADDAKKMGAGYLAGDFLASNTVPISCTRKYWTGTSKRPHFIRTTQVAKGVLDIHLRKDDIKTAHKSKLVMAIEQ